MADRRGGSIPLVRFAQRLQRRRKPVRILEIDDGGSDDGASWLAFVLGGVTIAGGLLAVIYFDGTRPRDALTTGSTLTIERPAPSRLAG